MKPVDVSAEIFEKASNPTAAIAQNDYFKAAENIVKGVNTILDKVAYIKSQSQGAVQKVQNLGVQPELKSSKTPSAARVAPKIITKEPIVDEGKLKKAISELIKGIPKLDEGIKEKKIGDLPELYKENSEFIEYLLVTKLKPLVLGVLK